MKRLSGLALVIALLSLSLVFTAYADSFSKNWYEDGTGWHIKDASGKTITNAWVCDDVQDGSKNTWYLIDANGIMVSSPLVQDGTGNYYSLEQNHNGTYGMLRYKNGTYDGIAMTFNQEHKGSFAAITDQTVISKLNSAFGTKSIANINNNNIIYTTSLGSPAGGSTGGNGGSTGGGSADSARIAKTVSDGEATHNYYSNIPAEGKAQAEAIAKGIADSVLSDSSLNTDQKKVNAAAKAVYGYCSKCTYTSDANKYYRSPYGVFVAGVYTCAGSTRALGRVLDYMGYTWVHANENKDEHQWCIVDMDGRTGWADGMGGNAGFGQYSEFGAGVDQNPTGAYTSSSESAAKLSQAKATGGTLTFRYYNPYAYVIMPIDAVKDYNVNDIDTIYDDNVKLTFNADDAITYHNHFHAECHPWQLCPSRGEYVYCDGDVPLGKAKEGTNANGVHYIQYKGSTQGMDGGSIFDPGPSVMTTDYVITVFDVGIITLEEHHDNEYHDKWSSTITMALR